MQRKLKELLENGGFKNITKNTDGSFNGECSGFLHTHIKMENGIVTYDGCLKNKGKRQKIEVGVLL